MTPRLPPWLLALLPLTTWLGARIVFVSPAARQVALAHQQLLAAEREELAETIAVERDELIIERMKGRVETMLADAERLRIAAATAQAELSHGVYRSGSGHWVMPGERIVGNLR